MATIGKVSAVFTASTSGLRSGVNQATSAMSTLERAAQSTARGMRALVAIQGIQFFGNMASQAVGYVRSLVDIGRGQAEVIDSSSKLAARLGVTYREMAGLSLAGDLAGVSMDTIGAAMTKADVAFVRAAEGSKTARNAFRGIGLAVEDLNGLSAAERFDAITNAIAALPTEAQKAEAAVQLFGRAGAQLLPLFAGGAGAIADATDQAEKLGLALTDAQGRDVEAMNDSFTMVAKAIDGVVQQVVAYLAPAITGIANQFVELVGSIGGANIGSAIGEALMAGARMLAQVGDYIIQNVPAVWQYISAVGQQWGGVWSVAQRVGNVFIFVAKALEAAFKFVGSILTGTIGRVMNSIGELAQFVPGMGKAGKEIEQSGEFLMRQSKKMWNESGQAAKDSAAAFARAISPQQGDETGKAIAGPLVTAIDAGRAKALEAATSIEKATAKPIDIQQTATAEVNMDPVKKAVEGIDSRSSEGLKTMFRIMRGDNGEDVQERQLRVQEDMLDELRQQTDDGDEFNFDVVNLAPAAGA